MTKAYISMERINRQQISISPRCTRKKHNMENNFCRLVAPLHLIPCVMGRSGMALKSARPSEVGTTISAELKRRRVIHATTNNRTMRRAKLYLLKLQINKDYKFEHA